MPTSDEQQEQRRRNAREGQKALRTLASLLTWEATQEKPFSSLCDNDEHNATLKRAFIDGRGHDLNAIIEVDGIPVYVSLSIAEPEDEDPT